MISNEEINTIGTFNKLNFDCLVHICSFLELKDLTNLYKISNDFEPVIEHAYKRYKSLDFHSIRPVTFSQGKKAINKFGPYIKSIKINGEDVELTQCEAIRLFNLVNQVCINLENIWIESINISDELLKEMSKLFPKLKSIELIKCNLCEDDDDDDNSTEYDLETYLEAAKILKKLNLRDNKKIDGGCISAIINLDSLNLRGCRNVDPDYFTEFCMNNKTIIHLDIAQCDNLTSTSVTDITTNLKNLEDLTISSSYCEITSNDFLEFVNLPKLKKLFIKFNNSVNKKIVDLIIHLAEKDLLQFLDISRIPITKQLFEALVSFTKLEVLKINNSFFYLNDEMLSQLMAKKENIKELHISNSGMVKTAGLIKFIENSPNLRVLDISFCQSISNDFYYRVLNILKEQNRQHHLSVFVYGTKMIEKCFISRILAENLPWIQLKFVCLGFFNPNGQFCLFKN